MRSKIIFLQMLQNNQGHATSLWQSQEKNKSSNFRSWLRAPEAEARGLGK
jgi:hypothetical protein